PGRGSRGTRGRGRARGRGTIRGARRSGSPWKSDRRDAQEGRAMKLLRTTLLFLLLPALATAAPAPLPREKRMAEPGGGSKPVDGLRIRLLAPQTRDRAGGTVPLGLESQNVSGARRAVEEPHLSWSISDRASAGWSITCDRDGRGCPRAAFKELKRMSEWRKLPAGRTLRVEITAKAELQETKLQEMKREEEDEPRRQ